VIAAPEMMTAAAADLAAIGSNVDAAHMAAAARTTAVVPAAADEVSTGIAHLFSGYGQEYQKLAGQAAASYEQFAQHLTASAGAYASAEAANVASLQPVTASAGSIGSAIGGLLQQLGLENLIFNLVTNEFLLQLGVISALAQLAGSNSFLSPLVQLAAVGLYFEFLLTFGILLTLFPPTF
jgi:hypothetical protein